MTAIMNGHQPYEQNQWKRSDALLSGVAEAARRLLAIADFDAAVNGALEAIGTAAGIDRIYILENYIDSKTGEELGTLPYEWTAPGVVKGQGIPGRFPMSYADFGDWLERWKQGETVQALTRDLSRPAQELQKKDDALSLLTVPILTDGFLWGVIGFDDCTTERVWSDAEIAVLQTAAACIGSSIERDRARKAREAVARARAQELETHNQVLARRDRILQATATASNVLLNSEDFDASVSEALEILGESLGFDRIGVGQQLEDPTGESSGFLRFLYEWDGPGISAQLEDYEDMSDFHWDEMGMRSWYEANLRGEAFGQLLKDLPEPFRTIQQSVDVKSTHNIPIFVEGQFWGVFGVDHCREKILLTEVELVALKTAANCVGGAIARDRSRKDHEAVARERAAELEAHNQALAERDRILEATAAAANVMLTGEDFDSAVNKALKIVGEGLDVDRAGLMVYFDGTDGSPGYHQQMYEWDASGISAQIEHPELMRVSDEGIEFAVEQLARGEVFGGIVEELPEPFRSGQQEIGAQSTYAVPIFAERRYWGVVSLDDCRHKTRRSEAELEALMTLANCVGSAIEQEQVRQARAAETEAHNQALAERDRILEATAAAANVMLTDEDFGSAVKRAIALIGEGLAVDRVALMQRFDATENGAFGYHESLHEWAASGISLQIEHPELHKVSDDGVDFLDELLRGKVAGGVVDELPEPFRSSQVEVGVQSTYAVPIMVEGRYWGLIGLDDCYERTRRSEAELEALMTLANCIGSAIERERNRQAREAAERTAILEGERAARAAALEAANEVLMTRDRWLETTAAAANELLSTTDIETSVKAALATIGENLECDRVAVLQHVDDPNGHPLGAVKGLYEWDAQGIRAQIDDPDLQLISAEGFEDWFTRFHAGEWVGGNVADLPEPARSGQEALGVLSTYAVPIFIDDRLWGTVGMDYCRQERALSAAELAVFQTAASCVGSAIYQAQVRRDKAAQERAKLLGSVAKAANLLLRSADFTEVLPEVTRLLGEAVGSDRCAIGQDVVHPNSNKPTVKVRADWEWCSTATLASGEFSLAGEELFYWDDAPYIAAKLRNGEVANFLAQDLPEPDRSFMAAQGNTAELIVPIFDSRLWGFIAFDNCGESRLYDEAEISILRVAAESIAAAIARQSQDEALRNAEKAVFEEREKAARDRATELAKTNEAIAHTLTSLTEAPELDEFLGQILSKLSEAIEACKAHLFLYDEPTHTLRQHLTVQDGQAYQGAAPSDPEMFRHPIPADLSGGWQTILESEKPFTVDERNPDNEELLWPETIPWHQAQGHLSATCACMRVGHKPIGFIGFAFRHLPALSDEQLEFIQALTNQATLSIQLTRLADQVKQSAILQEQEKAARERAAQLSRSNQALKRSLDSLAQQPELEAFLQGVVNEATAQTGADSGHLFLHDAATRTFSLRVSTVNNGDWRCMPDMALWLQPVSAEEAPDFWAKIFEQRKAFAWEDMQSTLKPGPHIWEPSIDWHLQRGHTSAICAPLLLGDNVLGFFGLAFVGEPNITHEDLELAQALTNQATLAIQFTRLAEDAKQAAILQEQEKAARERAAELAKANESIGQTLTTLAARPDLDEFLGYILAEMANQVEACKVHLFLYDEQTHTLTQRVVIQDGEIYLGAGPNDPEILRHPIPADITTGWDAIINSPQPLIYDETQPFDETVWWPETIDWHKKQGHKVVACIPMKAGDVPIGYIGFCFKSRIFLSDEQLEFMQALANQSIVAIQLTRLGEEAKQAAILQEQEKAAQKRAAQLTRSNQALKSSLDSLAQQPELEAFLQQVVNEAVAQTGAANGHLFLYDSAAETFSLHVATENGGDWHSVQDMELWLQPVSVNEAPAFFVTINAKKPFYVQDLPTNLKPGREAWEPSIQWHLQRGHRSLICAPLAMGERVLGFMGLPFVEDSSVTQDDIELAQALSNQATLAVQITRLAEQARTNALNDERTRLAREIHDTLAQAFTGVSLQLEAVRSITTPKDGSPPSSQDFTKAQTYIRRARDLARAGLSEARRSVRALRSEALETDTLPEALRKVLAQTQRDTGLTTRFSLEGSPIPLPDDIELNLLRIGQEALTNTLRHAQASQFELTLRFTSDSIQLYIADNGHGFDPTQLPTRSGFGLQGIRERATRFYGTFELLSTPGLGTTIDVCIPLST